MQSKHLSRHQTESHMQTNISVDAGFSFKLLALGYRLGRALEFLLWGGQCPVALQLEQGVMPFRKRRAFFHCSFAFWSNETSP